MYEAFHLVWPSQASSGHVYCLLSTLRHFPLFSLSLLFLFSLSFLPLFSLFPLFSLSLFAASLLVLVLTKTMGKKSKTSPAPTGNSTAETALGQGPPRVVPNAGYMAGPGATGDADVEGLYSDMPGIVGPAAFGESDYLDVADEEAEGAYFDVKPEAAEGAYFDVQPEGDAAAAADGSATSPGFRGGSSYYDVMGGGAGGMSNFGADGF